MRPLRKTLRLCVKKTNTMFKRYLFLILTLYTITASAQEDLSNFISVRIWKIQGGFLSWGIQKDDKKTNKVVVTKYDNNFKTVKHYESETKGNNCILIGMTNYFFAFIIPNHISNSERTVIRLDRNLNLLSQKNLTKNDLKEMSHYYNNEDNPNKWMPDPLHLELENYNDTILYYDNSSSTSTSNGINQKCNECNRICGYKLNESDDILTYKRIWELSLPGYKNTLAGKFFNIQDGLAYLYLINSNEKNDEIQKSTLICINYREGKVVYTTELQLDQQGDLCTPFLSNLYYDKEKNVLIGAGCFVDKSKKKKKSLMDGYFLIEIDKAGHVINSKKYDFNVRLQEHTRESSDAMKFIIIHEIVKTADGNYRLLGEIFKFKHLEASVTPANGIPGTISSYGTINSDKSYGGSSTYETIAFLTGTFNDKLDSTHVITCSLEDSKTGFLKDYSASINTTIGENIYSIILKKSISPLQFSFLVSSVDFNKIVYKMGVQFYEMQLSPDNAKIEVIKEIKTPKDYINISAFNLDNNSYFIFINKNNEPLLFKKTF